MFYPMQNVEWIGPDGARRAGHVAAAGGDPVPVRVINDRPRGETHAEAGAVVIVDVPRAYLRATAPGPLARVTMRGRVPPVPVPGDGVPAPAEP